MANMSMADEITALKEELARLKRSETQKLEEAHEEERVLDSLVEGAFSLEEDLESKAHELVEQMKLDYDNMSPATAVAIFSAGALFGRLFLSK